MKRISQFDGGRKLPEGWAVREPCPGDNNWRVEHDGIVHDARPTEAMALRRAWAIIDRRPRRSFGRG
jgi:hypothetical protein